MKTNNNRLRQRDGKVIINITYNDNSQNKNDGNEKPNKINSVIKMLRNLFYIVF
jgi:hypothetical protein